MGFDRYRQVPLGAANHVQCGKVERGCAAFNTLCLAGRVGIDTQGVGLVITEQAIQRGAAALAQGDLQLRVGSDAGEVAIELCHALIQAADLLAGVALDQCLVEAAGVAAHGDPEHSCGGSNAGHGQADRQVDAGQPGGLAGGSGCFSAEFHLLICLPANVIGYAGQ